MENNIAKFKTYNSLNIIMSILGILAVGSILYYSSNNGFSIPALLFGIIALFISFLNAYAVYVGYLIVYEGKFQLNRQYLIYFNQLKSVQLVTKEEVTKKGATTKRDVIEFYDLKGRLLLTQNKDFISNENLIELLKILSKDVKNLKLSENLWNLIK